MCSPRCNAITAPSIESQRNRIDASSSDQISGLWRTYRLMTPASKMTISNSTRPAVTVSTAAPSRRPALPQALMMPRGDKAETGPSPASTLSVIGCSATVIARSGQLADGAFEQPPGFIAEAGLPLGVEAGVAQLGTEAIGCRLGEREPLRLEVRLHGCVEGLDVVSLFQAGIVDGVGDDRLDVAGQRFPGPAIGDEPEAVPDVVADGAVFLHLVELGDLDDRQRVFLRVDDAGLQRRIDFAELQAGRRGRQRLEHGDAERADRHPDLQPIHILGTLDR